MFEDSFLDLLPENPLYALWDILAEFEKRESDAKRGKITIDLRFFLRALALLERYGEAAEVEIDGLDRRALEQKDEVQVIEDIRGFVSDLKARTKRKIKTFEFEESVHELDAYRDEFSSYPRNEISYEFSDSDISTIQRLISELREEISQSKVLEENHKQRLLVRLEKLQQEFHKKMSNLDRFWAFLGEAGSQLGQFGEDVKPLTDRIREMAGVIIRVSNIPNSLMIGGNHLLPEHNEGEDSEN